MKYILKAIMSLGQRRSLRRKTAKHREYSSVMTRQLSFKGSQMTPGQSPAALARAGFFYVGHKDYVKCFCCGILISKLHPGEDMIAAHRRKSPNCSFIAGPNDEQSSSGSSTPIDSQVAERLSTEMNRLVVNMGYDAEIVQRAYQLCQESAIDQGPIDIEQVTNKVLQIKINESRPNIETNNTLLSNTDSIDTKQH